MHLELPININGVELKDYQKFMKIAEANPDVENNFLDIKLLEIVCKLDYNTISKMPITIFDEILGELAKVFSEKTPLVNRFNMTDKNGEVVEFGLVPNLDKLSLGEYIDLNTYFDDLDEMHKAMAVLYRPIHPSFRGKPHYRIAEYQGTEEFSEIMKEMPLGIALGAKVFFYRLGMKLAKLTVSYSQKILMKEAVHSEEVATLLKDMDGISNSILSQEVKRSEYLRQLNYRFTKQ